jgi:hypothetical protein
VVVVLVKTGWAAVSEPSEWWDFCDRWDCPVRVLYSDSMAGVSDLVDGFLEIDDGLGRGQSAGCPGRSFRGSGNPIYSSESMDEGTLETRGKMVC